MNRPLYDIQRHLHLQARRRPAQPVERLLRFVTDWTVIREAWRRVRTSQGADTPGADRLSARDLPSESSATRVFLQNLADQLQSGTYQPGPVRRFSIAKPNHPGQTRPLAILTLADRVAHMAIKLVLEPIVEARLGKRCFGFRPGRNRYDQIQSIRRLMLAHPDEFGAALCADVASCFDFLDHEIIVADLEGVTTDAAFRSLFCRVLEQVGSGQAGWWRKRRVGVLQGSPLSPLVANWTLARFDRAWQRDHAERAPLFRYADDLVVLARGPAEAARLRRPLDRCLWAANRLALSPEKTRTATLDRGIPLLGLLLRRHEDLFADRDDVRVFIDPKVFRDVLSEIDDWVEQLDPGRPLRTQFARFNQRLRGWFETYQYAYDAAQAFDSLDRHLFVALRHRLKDLTASSAAQLDADHHVRLESGHDTWQAGGVAALVAERTAAQVLPAQKRPRPVGSSSASLEESRP